MFFDKLLNPVWHAAKALGEKERVTLALVITSYGGCRQAVLEHLVAPVEKGLASAPSSLQRAQLIDEALVALLKSSGPFADKSGKLGRCSTALLRQALGSLALADLSARNGSPALTTLDESPYSLQRDEARTQFLVQWRRILKIDDLQAFIDLTSRLGLPAKWQEMSLCLLGGMLLGAGRVSNSTLLSRARQLTKSFTPYQQQFLQYLVEKLSAAPA
jgi:hypothetical protein